MALMDTQASRGLERELESCVAGDEAEVLIEAVRIGTGVVRGELDQSAAVCRGLPNRPAQQGLAHAPTPGVALP